jgi:hypothetical protein
MSKHACTKCRTTRDRWLIDMTFVTASLFQAAAFLPMISEKATSLEADSSMRHIGLASKRKNHLISNRIIESQRFKMLFGSIYGCSWVIKLSYFL